MTALENNKESEKDEVCKFRLDKTKLLCAKIALMIDFKDKVFEGSDGRKSLFDCVIPEGATGVIVFVHGYKGYKDWGAWSLMEKAFVEQGFGFVKFNMTHNGGTVDEPVDFPDLDAFGRNRYTYELYDLSLIVEETHRMITQELQLDIPIHILGHSRGGGVAVLYSSKDPRVSKVVSLAGISDIGSRFPVDEELEEWQASGVYYVLNGRTKQSMPHFFSFYEDFKENEERLNIENAARELNKPFLQIHGDMDQAVSISEGLSMAEWTETRVKIIKGAEHTFGTYHPYDQEELTEEMNEVVKAVVEFLVHGHLNH